MPNHCENHVTISGSSESIAKLKELLGDSFSFESILPIPEELIGIHSGHTEIDGVTYDAWRTDDPEDAFTDAIGIGDEEQAELVAKYGAYKERDWICDHWGTKWNPYEVTVSYQSQSIIAYFLTAWCPPDGIFKAITLQFPDLLITCTYAIEMGQEGTGSLEYQDGVEVVLA